MTMSVAAAGLSPVPPTPPAVAQPAGQDLFQYLATVNPSGIPAAPNPGQLGGAMLDHLKGFVERSQTMPGRANALTNPAQTAPAKLVHHGSDATQVALRPSDGLATSGASRGGQAPGKPPVGDAQFDKVIQSLGMMFDYSIETQMVVRGTTQVSGAANTLLRGQ